MRKSQFYKKYIEDSRTEDQKMMDIIHHNAQKERIKYNYRKRTNQRNKGIKTFFTGVLISYLTIILLLLVILWK